jgi:hypothetical protein
LCSSYAKASEDKQGGAGAEAGAAGAGAQGGAANNGKGPEGDVKDAEFKEKK